MEQNQELRVIDFSAKVSCHSYIREIVINKKLYRRRVIDFPAYVAIISETSGVKSGIDGWHCENPALEIKHDHYMAVLFSGDRKCSSSTWWNTGNPRNLVEVVVHPIEHVYWTTKGQRTTNLWRWLADLHPVATPYCRPHDPIAWFKASPDSLLRDVLEFVGNRYDPHSRVSAPHRSDPRTMLYLAVEGGEKFVKLGKCAGGRTSPPERRVAMYSSANPRGIGIAAQWVSMANVPERQLQKALRDECHRLRRRCRAEWFELDPEEAMHILEKEAQKFSLTTF